MNVLTGWLELVGADLDSGEGRIRTCVGVNPAERTRSPLGRFGYLSRFPRAGCVPVADRFVDRFVDRLMRIRRCASGQSGSVSPRYERSCQINGVNPVVEAVTRPPTTIEWSP